MAGNKMPVTAKMFATLLVSAVCMLARSMSALYQHSTFRSLFDLASYEGTRNIRLRRVAMHYFPCLIVTSLVCAASAGFLTLHTVNVILCASAAVYGATATCLTVHEHDSQMCKFMFLFFKVLVGVAMGVVVFVGAAASIDVLFCETSKECKLVEFMGLGFAVLLNLIFAISDFFDAPICLHPWLPNAVLYLIE